MNLTYQRHPLGPPIDAQTTRAYNVRRGHALIFHSKNTRCFNRALDRSLADRDARFTRFANYVTAIICNANPRKHAYRGKKHPLLLRTIGGEWRKWRALQFRSPGSAVTSGFPNCSQNTINFVCRAKRAVKEFLDPRLGLAKGGVARLEKGSSEKAGGFSGWGCSLFRFL